MDNKIYVVISVLVFILAGEFLAFTIGRFNRPPGFPNSVLGSTDTKATSDVVKKLCENYYSDTKIIQAPQKPRAVTQCGNYYRVEPPASAGAAPYKMITRKGDVAAICGSTSLDSSIESFEQKECELPCSLGNLCGAN